MDDPATSADSLEAVKEAERRGELLTAFDLAERSIARFPDDVALKHRAVLALARAGSTGEAARRFEEYGLGAVETEDVAALLARITKDAALAATGEERARRAARAAALYGAIFARTGGYYPAVNAATMTMLAGDCDAAGGLARRVLDLVVGDDDYYAAATEAEARLLLGDADGASAALARAADLRGGDEGAAATTRRQLRLVCELTGADASLLAPLAGPGVAHYCGHLISPNGGPFAAADQGRISARIAEELGRRSPAYAYGSLANGADILWAEALLARGAELHVVLPFGRDEFVRTSVAPGGAGWVERFERCLSGAASLTYATEDAYLGDEILFRYGAELAMGLALLRARYLDADAWQLTVWNGEPPSDGFGTAVEVDTWRRLGLPIAVVACNGHRPVASSPGGGRPHARVTRALLFGDVAGFSKLTDEQIPRFAHAVFGAFATVLDVQGGAVCARNTWGDALYVVLSDAVAAATCALELQAALEAVDLEANGLPAHLALRLGGHLGPVLPVDDPVTGGTWFMGSHTSRTARIEPVTPPGSVYVTEPFAAALALAGRDDLVADYVGHLPAAKDFGHLRMYSLRRR